MMKAPATRAATLRQPSIWSRLRSPSAPRPARATGGCTNNSAGTTPSRAAGTAAGSAPSSRTSCTELIVPAGSPVSLDGRATVTYRRILTGVVVAELRASSAVPASSALVDPDADREPMAAAIDQILTSSVSLGRHARLVTGWDHLVQPFDFSFTASAPSATDSSGRANGLFLLCYLGSGTEVELPDGTDSLIVTPFNSTQYQVLPVGMALRVTP